MKKKIPALNNGDDLLGFREVKWDSHQLKQMRDSVRDAHLAAAKGSGEVLTTTGKMDVRPSLRPEYQQEFVSNHVVRFTDNNVDYTLGYSIRFKNHQYLGPYQP